MFNKKYLMKNLLAIMRAAGQILIGESSSGLTIQYKDEADIVTNVDKAVERYIVDQLQAITPHVPLFSEELGLTKAGKSDYLWLIDPLDGTTNFVHGFPYYAISIALTYKADPIVGIVYDVSRDELFWASIGEGAFCNGRRINVSKTSQLQNSLVVTAFAIGRNPDNDINMQHFKNAYQYCQAVRRTGAAALDLCYIATGRLDAFLQKRINSYDIAAGVLILKEAGGIITSLLGNPFDLYSGEILASNGLIHSELLAKIID